MAKIKTGPKVKRKGGGIPAKGRAVDALAEQLRGSTAVIVADYRGLRVGELQDLRKRLRPKGVEFHVVKNSLFTRAAAKTERAGLASLLSGPTAVALGNIDEVELAKGMVDEARVLKSLRILGAFIGGKTMSVDDVQDLAKLPSRAYLQAQIVGSLQAPLAQLAGLFQAPARNLIHVLTARAQ